MNKELQVGDSVMLSPDHQWDEGPGNPTNTLGKLLNNKVKDTDGKQWWVVEWSNGWRNSYPPDGDDLIKMPDVE